MVRAPIPANEAQRLAAVRDCQVLDSAPEPAYDGIALLASQLCGTPIALVSVVDASRQWFKARVGLTSVAETSRDVAFCSHTILSGEPLVVEDALEDARFADNPLVTGEPHVRFYVGIPLVLEDGSAVGSLCVVDHVPRHLSAPQLSALSALGRQVSTELSLRRRLASTPPPAAPSPCAPTMAGPTLDQLTRRQPRAFGSDPWLPVPQGALIEQRYRVERVLGEGGMGVVARALDVTNGKTVALKFMRAEALTRRDALGRFVREAKALLKIESEHVARVFDVGNLPGGEPFIVMEYLEGEDLKTRLEREGPLPVGELVLLARQLCAALACAHGHGILHRDLKPANLFVIAREQRPSVLKVLDFGISKLLYDQGSLSGLTTDAMVVGSPHYMSPEQMMAPGEADARTDLWSTGVVLFELLAGTSPFGGVSLAEVCAQILNATPPLLTELRRDVPLALSEVIARCLQKQPALRYQSALELSAALARFEG